MANCNTCAYIEYKMNEQPCKDCNGEDKYESCTYTVERCKQLESELSAANEEIQRLKQYEFMYNDLNR